MIYSLFIIFHISIIQINTFKVQQRALNVDICENQSPVKWIASIQRNEKHTCNGLVMDSNALLTTALCCTEKLNCSSKGPNTHITVAHSNVQQQGLSIGSNCSITTVNYCIIHPEYKKQKAFIEYDACIVVLTDDLVHYEEAPLLNEFNRVKDYHEVCNNGTVIGRWHHFKLEPPNYLLECFPVTVKSLRSCAQVTTFVYLRKSNNFTLTCSYDASNRYEVCGGFYGAALMCNDKVVEYGGIKEEKKRELFLMDTSPSASISLQDRRLIRFMMTPHVPNLIEVV